MFRRFLKREEGSVTVFVAITMTVLLGFASLAVDYGSLVNERSLLQNAADAAALAGVVEGEDAAKEYVMKNTTGVAASDIEITKPAADTMTVTIRKDSPAFFSQVLTGNSSNRVAATATAKYEGSIQAPGCAIWAEDEIKLGNKSFVKGTIHSNSGKFYFDEKKIEGDWVETSDREPMPDYSYLIEG